MMHIHVYLSDDTLTHIHAYFADDTCSRSQPMRHTSINVTSFVLGSVMVVKCVAGYRFTDNASYHTALCKTNRRWTTIAAECDGNCYSS